MEFGSGANSEEAIVLEGGGKVRIHAELAAKLNFAAHQCAHPLVRDLAVENLQAHDAIDGLTLTLEANPPFVRRKEWLLDRIEPLQGVTVRGRDLAVDGALLRDLAESLRGTVTFRAGSDGAVLGEWSRQVELLACNEWGGGGFMPELLAAFVMPNDPAIDRILRSAGETLREAGKGPVDGYETGNRRHVWEIASAIYSAIAGLGLAYVLPPASFERDGQKIRFPSRIAEGGVGTCLDLAVLFAATCEQAGLHPIIAWRKGHALAGVWLQPASFASIVVDEQDAVRKRVDLDELLLVETTLVTSAPAPPFSKACEEALLKYGPDSEETHLVAVDISRARAHRITPLGLTLESRVPQPPPVPPSAADAFEEAPALPDFDGPERVDGTSQAPVGRLEQWHRKLLDLTLANRLLNHRAAKSSLQLVCDEPGRLAAVLTSGGRIRLKPLPATGQDEEIHRDRTGESIFREYARSELAQGRAVVHLPPDELKARAVTVYRAARSSLLEGGSNTLFLALGFLLWNRNTRDRRRYRAPLVLVPVTMRRTSVRSAFRIAAHDDEPRFNPTLVEMLRRDFGVDLAAVSGKLMSAADGGDVERVLRDARIALKDVPGFTVVDEVVLGNFSFAKYLMWKDLADRADSLRRNAVVRHLIDCPGEPFPSAVQFVEPQDVDREHAPSDLLAPLLADSSQLAAIATADRGKDFVVIGPPGTGKSQTIANMITHFLGKGKTVLFVSEKTAALEVVYRRLEEIGIGQFCLELHSNKARKTDVLNQLSRVLESREAEAASDWTARADALRKRRDHLNEVVAHLHTAGRSGLTPFLAMGIKIRDEELASKFSLSWPSADQHDGADLEALRTLVGRLHVFGESVGQIPASPLGLVTHHEWSPGWQRTLVERAERLEQAALDANLACDSFGEAIRLVLPDRTSSRLRSLGELAELLVTSHGKPGSYALTSGGQGLVEALDEATIRLRTYAAAHSSLSCTYAAFAWRRLDGREIAERWTEANARLWPGRAFERGRIKREMRRLGALGKPDVPCDAKTLAVLRTEGRAIDGLDSTLRPLPFWQGHDTDPEVTGAAGEHGRCLREVTRRLAGPHAGLRRVREAVREVLANRDRQLRPGEAMERAASQCRDALDAVRRASEEFEECAGISPLDKLGSKPDVLDRVRQAAAALAAASADLKIWCGWLAAKYRTVDSGLYPLVAAVESGRIAIGEVAPAFEAAYHAWWSAAVIDNDSVLRTLSGPWHEAQVASFRESESEFRSLTARWVRQALASALREKEQQGHASEWGVIRKEVAKKTRHKPVRQLLQEAPTAVTALAPCFMMSPLSIAQYLSADQALFDVVIFDEASQITPWEAVGSLARGKQAIVVGDPKQMPPTQFFARGSDSGVDYDTDEDLESILDEMLAAGIPTRQLNLHYRSRREGLIAFSNARYYDSGLTTFPHPGLASHGVRLVRSNGVYERGGSRCNRVEAEAVVAEIARRVTHRNPAVRDLSIGVVTFNSEQQGLIEDLLDRARAGSQTLDDALSGENLVEPIFVKNLETVQGDERDVILFSVTYGPDRSGTVSMNFGPLNRTGSERRLNVAMTRARSEMIVFSSLDPADIDLSRSHANAVRDLKHFLEYAERGPAAMGASRREFGRESGSAFESAIADELGKRGWSVRHRVGVSSYRIDLGVVHPDHPERFLAGIECDGEMYQSSRVACERDKIRDSVLRELGWTLFRAWSVDWWANKVRAAERLHESLEGALEDDRRAALETPEPQDRDEGSRDAPAESAGADDAADATDPAAVRFPPQGSDWEAVADGHRYVRASLGDLDVTPDPEAFYSAGYSSALREIVDRVVEIEGPVHENVLVQRVSRFHEFSRAGKVIRKTVLGVGMSRYRQTEENVGRFYWVRGALADGEAPARFVGRDDELRKVEHIAPEEILAIDSALKARGNVAEIARNLGMPRLSPKARARIEQAVRRRDPSES